MKNRITPKEAKSIMARVPVEKSIWLCTNDTARSLSDLGKILQSIEDETFRYHVNRDKNDFEQWISAVIHDKELAREIARVKTKETLVRKVLEREEFLRKLIKRMPKPKPRVKKKKKSVRRKKTAVKKKSKKKAKKTAKRKPARKKTKKSKAKKKTAKKRIKKKKTARKKRIIRRWKKRR